MSRSQPYSVAAINQQTIFIYDIGYQIAHNRNKTLYGDRELMEACNNVGIVIV